MRILQTAIAAALLGVSSLAFAAEEFNKECAMGLALGQRVPTDCSITWTDPGDGKTYCFSSEASRNMFLQAPAVNLRKAYDHFGRR